MGGGAFLQAAAHNEPTLQTPRMSPAEYANLKSIYLQRLKARFSGRAVTSLLEAPEKTSYGDIDFIVSSYDQQVDCIDLAQDVGARGVIDLSSGTFQRCTLAVPKDGSKSVRPAVEYKQVLGNRRDQPKPSELFSKELLAQIDVEIISPDLFEWHSFYASYGDLAGLLGKFVHNLGFTICDKGLILRLKELDDAKTLEFVQVADTNGKLFLTKDPNAVMRFVGLSPETYWAGFTTMDSFYAWLGECRLCSPETIKYKRTNSHERNREKKRTVYSKFLEEWLPKHFELDTDQVSDAENEEDAALAQAAIDSAEALAIKRRQALRDEAIAFFDKRAEFESMHLAICLLVRQQTAAYLLKPIVTKHSQAKDKKLAEIIRAFRRWVAFDANREPYILSVPHTDEESQLHLWLDGSGTALASVDQVDAWVKKNWEGLKELQRQKVKGEKKAS